MKKAILIIIIALPTFILAQEKKFEFGFSIGNNGQLDKILNDFYTYGSETSFLDDSNDAKTTNIKYTSNAEPANAAIGPTTNIPAQAHCSLLAPRFLKAKSYLKFHRFLWKKLK